MLIPKAEDLSSEKDYKPLTYLNILCKIFTGILAQHVKKHIVQNELWDKSQMGTCEKVLGTVDQLIIDNSIIETIIAICLLHIMSTKKHTTWFIMDGY